MPTMLPAAPKTLGRLSDVFISALGAITGHSNHLGFKRVSKAVVILVDGLGAENLRAAGGHAPFLNAALKASKSINTVFPSTTAAAITSFGLSASPSISGIFGYSVFDRDAGVVRNLLSGWSDDFTPGEYQQRASVSHLAQQNDVPSYSVGPGEYADSGFTKLNMAGAEFIAAKTFEDRIEATLQISRSKHRSLTYLYFPELDSLAHSRGVNSSEWLNKLEDLDSAVKTLVAQLPQEVGVLLTADHGIVDVPSENHLLLDEFELPGLLAVTGDPRNSFLYFERGSDLVKKKNNLQELSGDNFIVATFEDLVQSGWFEKETSNPQFMPDLFLISTGNFACYHRGFAKPQSLRMIGQHGSISTAELSVPLLKLGAFAG